ncbi:hypothetical protein [Pseudanabaena sp. FACHB-2040]|uniref:hypothetical protein n=1 Tax=Pseudanabaena sp. FACHB-2040 TaxID=2692859 RepID=UPI001689AE90|nr:hypothetical protein [Pseudanabaena sp. FACHB-2040]MBD2260223.1 hypothetical protein [Pseudanabaena sp. FACHB-2040]
MKHLTLFAGRFLNGGLRSLLLVCLVSLMSWLMAANQPAYAIKADPSVAPTQEHAAPDKQGKIYDESLKVVDPPRGESKEIQESLRKYRQESPDQNADQGGLVEGLKELVDNFTPGDK